jgi:hypothetical protein
MKMFFRFTEKELVDIYKIAFDSFLSRKGTLNKEYDYLAIDMSTTFFDNISQEGKQQILDYFKNKYNIEVMNESLNTLVEKGLATKIVGKYVMLKSNGKWGILVKIINEKIVSETEVVIEGQWFVSPTAAEGYSTTIVFEEGQWKLQKTGIIWVS